MECSVIQVEWKDHASTSARWQPADNKGAKPVLFKSVGFVLRDEPDHYVITSTVEDDPNDRITTAQFTILKADITSLKVIANASFQN